MDKKWIIKNNQNLDAVQKLSSALGISSVTASILISRDVESTEDGKQFFSPSISTMYDPFLLKGVQTAIDRIIQAVNDKELVCIYGDYDVDGISGTALLVSFLRRIGLNCTYFIPNRFNDGYGLNQESIQQIIDLGVSLIISVDCGITSVKEAEFCKTSGVDLIITDHHTPSEIIPNATAVVNPLQPGCLYPFKMLAGVGVAFNILVALRTQMRRNGMFSVIQEPDLREWLDLVALGTIADVVPLIGQNRMYVYLGLQRLKNSSRAGISALKKVAGIKELVTCGQVAFQLTPRLNAAGRMESAVPGVELLLNTDINECATIADELNSANSTRQEIERSVLEQALNMIDTLKLYPTCRSIVLASTAWHQGVIGIVASRLVERFHRPTLLIAIDENGNAKGSGRSIPEFHLLEALQASSTNLDRFGGHKYAAGVTLKAENIKAFAESFESVATDMIGDSELVSTLFIDAEVEPSDLNLQLANEIKRLEPFGSGNPEPTLLMREVMVIDKRIVGDGHLKLRISAGGEIFEAIAFRQAKCETDGILDIAFFPETNTWNNKTSLQLRIKAIRNMEA